MLMHLKKESNFSTSLLSVGKSSGREMSYSFVQRETVVVESFELVIALKLNDFNLFVFRPKGNVKLHLKKTMHSFAVFSVKFAASEIVLHVKAVVGKAGGPMMPPSSGSEYKALPLEPFCHCAALLKDIFEGNNSQFK